MLFADVVFCRCIDLFDNDAWHTNDGQT